MTRYFTIFVLLLAPFAQLRKSTLPAPPMIELRGVDVSHYQKQISWDTVAAYRAIDFAFVKATEGHDFVDSMFCRNWESLRRIGIARGAYHFFRAYGCGEEQAALFLSQVEMHPGDLAPVLDIERTDGIPPEIMREEATIWLQKVEATLKIKPIIYSNLHFYEKYLAGHFDHYPLWIARYSEDTPYLDNGKAWDIWQYSNVGCIDGISEKVDMNVFPGSLESLGRLRWYPEATIATP